jgi:hypothetical protein
MLGFRFRQVSLYSKNNGVYFSDSVNNSPYNLP